MWVRKWCKCENPGSCGFGPGRCLKCGLLIYEFYKGMPKINRNVPKAIPSAMIPWIMGEQK